MKRIVGCIVVVMLTLAGCGKDKSRRATNLEALRRQKKLKEASKEQKTVIVPSRTANRATEPPEGQAQPVAPTEDQNWGSRKAVKKRGDASE